MPHDLELASAWRIVVIRVHQSSASSKRSWAVKTVGAPCAPAV